MHKSEQLAQNLKLLILDGQFTAHEKLPSLRDQVQITGYSLMTVLNAYQSLEAQGLVYAVEKSGFFVSAHLPANKNIQTNMTLHEHISMNGQLFQYLKSIQSADIVPFGSAFPDPGLLSPNKLLQLLAQLSRDKSYFDQQPSFSPGHPELRKLIAQRYSLQGIPTQADDIVITSGALDALNLSLQALTRPGDYIVLQQTIFYGAWQVAERLGLNVVTIPEHPSEGFDVAAFEQALNDYPIKVCWFMLNCHNPIGFTVSAKIKQKIADLIQDKAIYVLEDDVYEELYATHKALPLKHYAQHDRVIHCSSFSKTLGASFRIGWVHAGVLSAQIQQQQLMSTVSANAFLQQVLLKFLTGHHYEKHLRQLRRQLNKNKQKISEYLKLHLAPQFEIVSHSGGYFLWIKLSKQLDSLQIYQALLAQFKIGVAPSTLFNVQHNPEQAIRINCSFAWSARIEQALQNLITFLHSQVNPVINAHYNDLDGD